MEATRAGRGKYKIAYVILFLLCRVFTPLTVRAEELSLPPHLIQTVGDQEIYEGLTALGLLECETLDTEDPVQAYEAVKNCVVRVNMGNAYGSGVIWRLTPEAVIIATNRHVLEYWDDAAGLIHFQQGYYVSARVLGSSERYDVGFLAVDREAFTYEELEGLRYVSADAENYEELEAQDLMFAVGAGAEMGALEYHEGTVEDPWRYIEDFDQEMLYGYGFAKAGMSGGGIFDGSGHYIGMLTAGTQRNEIAAVPLPSIVEAYGEIGG